MSEQDGRQAITIHPPATNDPEAWKAYWKAQGWPWRTEPEIDTERQKYLAERRSIPPDIEQGIYPFKNVKLNRADVEWLLATHESEGVHGPVIWSDESQRKRMGLDIRGADLCGVDLRNLPLARLCGALPWEEWMKTTEEGSKLAAILMNEANLSGAQLEEADLSGAQLERAYLFKAQLEGAHLNGAQLQRAYLTEAQLQRAYLTEAQLQRANLAFVQLQKADLRGAQLQRANLNRAQLQKADLTGAQLEKASLSEAQLEEANLMGAQLDGAYLSKAELGGADLREAQLQGASLEDIKLNNKDDVSPRLADIQWSNTNLAVVDWSQVKRLGDEYIARQNKLHNGRVKGKVIVLREYKAAVRANRQLAIILREQGLNEEADHFAYRAQLLQRAIWRKQWRPLKYLLSWILCILAGYGYRPGRSIVVYLFVILGFAWAFFHLGQMEGHPFSPDGALVFSLTSFHGRGFFPGGLRLEDAITKLAAFEAVIGLLIEISFIATFTQKFFGK